MNNVTDIRQHHAVFTVLQLVMAVLIGLNAGSFGVAHAQALSSTRSTSLRASASSLPNTSLSIPQTFSFQGVLTDGSGNPVPDNTYNLTIRLFEGAAAGSAVYEETHNAVTQDGVFSIEVGAGTPAGGFDWATVPFDKGYYLEVQVSSDPPMSPRTKLMAHPYAIEAGGLGGGIVRIEMPSSPSNAPNIIAGHPSNNAAAGVEGATISGGGFDDGSNNQANEVTGNQGTIGGGSNNTASTRATVGGGFGNQATTFDATVGGGFSNTAGGEAATISGGDTNVASSNYATVSGGRENQATSTYAVVGGGDRNQAIGFASVVPGGLLNQAQGDYSFSAGQRADAAHNGSFVWADNSTSTTFASTGTNQFRVRSDGGVWFYSNSAATTGVMLANGAGSWTSASSVLLKDDFELVDPLSILDRIVAIPIQRWRYKSEDVGIRHVGPTAEDFYAAFGLGATDTGIATVDADGVALAAIQGLHALIQKQDALIEKQQAHLACLEKKIERLERSASAMSSQ